MSASLALRYVAGYDAPIWRITGWLRPGGRQVHSTEDPVCARDPMTGCVTTGGVTVCGQSTITPVKQPEPQQWPGMAVTKYHRRLATLVGGIIAAGLTLTGVDEPYPDHYTLGRRPDLADHRRPPPLLILIAQKP